MEYPIEVNLGTYTLRVYEDCSVTKKQITKKYGERWIPVNFTKETRIKKNGKINYYLFTLIIDGKIFYSRRHRLMYYAHHQDWNIFDSSLNNHIDHIHGTEAGDYIHNLRLVTHQQNQMNQQNAKGYCWDKNHKKWIAHICINRKRIRVTCDSEEEAIETRKQLKLKYHII
jgi:hypothetical protein